MDNLVTEGEFTTDAIPVPPRQHTAAHDNDEDSSDSSYSDISEHSSNMGAAMVYNISHSSNLHIGNNVTIINQEEKERKSRTLTTREKESLRSSLKTEDRHIRIVSSNIGKGWKEVGRRLEYKDPQFFQFEADYRINGIKEVIYQMLLDWIQATEDPTLGKLGTALSEAKEWDAFDELMKMENAS